MALGATRHNAVTLIVRQSITPVVIGAIIGLAIASQASRPLMVVLYGVSRFDPIALGGGLVFLVAATAIATWFPARRAASIDPVHVLRSE